ncbi:hypothetical protein JW933_00875 [candidate division FCPU426 bacterium]|nr:hypothetical protein [candidate division FCPU426 bacterium]
MGKVKGSAWLSASAFLKKKFGPDAVGRVLAQMDAEDERMLTQEILPISWLDYAAYTRFLMKADQVLGRGDKTLPVETGIAYAQNSMNGVYKAFLRILTPAMVLKKVAFLWSQVMSPGKMTVSKEMPKRVELIITDFPDMPLYHDVEQSSFIAEIARMTGIQNAKCSHPKCLARQDDHCLNVLTWD